MNINQKRKLYDRLYRHADKLIKKHNPCEIKDGKCIDGVPCCNECPHLGERGCTVECLECKVFLCGTANEHFRQLYRILKRIQIQAYRHNLLLMRSSKEEMFSYLERKEKPEIFTYLRREGEINGTKTGTITTGFGLSG